MLRVLVFLLVLVGEIEMTKQQDAKPIEIYTKGELMKLNIDKLSRKRRSEAINLLFEKGANVQGDDCCAMKFQCENLHKKKYLHLLLLSLCNDQATNELMERSLFSFCYTKSHNI